MSSAVDLCQSGMLQTVLSVAGAPFKNQRTEICRVALAVMNWLATVSDDSPCIFGEGLVARACQWQQASVLRRTTGLLQTKAEK